jgi:hypothetical protein
VPTGNRSEACSGRDQHLVCVLYELPRKERITGALKIRCCTLVLIVRYFPLGIFPEQNRSPIYSSYSGLIPMSRIGVYLANARIGPNAQIRAVMFRLTASIPITYIYLYISIYIYIYLYIFILYICNANGRPRITVIEYIYIYIYIITCI